MTKKILAVIQESRKVGLCTERDDISDSFYRLLLWILLLLDSTIIAWSDGYLLTIKEIEYLVTGTFFTVIIIVAKLDELISWLRPCGEISKKNDLIY